MHVYFNQLFHYKMLANSVSMVEYPNFLSKYPVRILFTYDSKADAILETLPATTDQRFLHERLYGDHFVNIRILIFILYNSCILYSMININIS